ncbi:MAG TPA: hypothetical protein P5089_02165 [Candidatus Portnoybacteria bacterium]|nr:hypothetical protein [Candidatus Portnoybacteria bacterium]
MFVKKNISWRKKKQLRIDVLGPYCEVCGTRTELLVGHHTNGRKERKKVCKEEESENKFGLCHWTKCQNRCIPCEVSLHNVYGGGNSPETEAIQKLHNAMILSWIEMRNISGCQETSVLTLVV